MAAGYHLPWAEAAHVGHEAVATTDASESPTSAADSSRIVFAGGGAEALVSVLVEGIDG